MENTAELFWVLSHEDYWTANANESRSDGIGFFNALPTMVEVPISLVERESEAIAALRERAQPSWRKFSTTHPAGSLVIGMGIVGSL